MGPKFFDEFGSRIAKIDQKLAINHKNDNVSNKMLLNAANARVIAFTISELLRKNVKIIPPLRPHPD